MNLNEIRTMKDHHYHEWSPEWFSSLKDEDPRRWHNISQDWDLPKGVSIRQRDVWVSLVVGDAWETTNLFLDSIKESAEIFKSPAIEGYRQKIAKIIFDEGVNQEEWGFDFLYDGLARYANTCFGKSESYYDIASEIMDHSIPLRWEQERAEKVEKEKIRLRGARKHKKAKGGSNEGDKPVAAESKKTAPTSRVMSVVIILGLAVIFGTLTGSIIGVFKGILVGFGYGGNVAIMTIFEGLPYFAGYILMSWVWNRLEKRGE